MAPMFRDVDKGFFKQWSPDMAYVLGFFAADGSMWRSVRGAHFFGFQINDRRLLESIRKVLRSTHKITTRNRRTGNLHWNNGYTLQIGSKEMFEDLLQLGMTPSKSDTLSFPEIPEEHVGDFVRGYFDGDGNVYFGKHFSKSKGKKVWVFSSGFTSGCRRFLESLLQKLRPRGVNGGCIVLKYKGRGYDLTFSRRDSLALYGIMYDTIPTTALYLPRKNRIFRRAIKKLYPDAVVV